MWNLLKFPSDFYDSSQLQENNYHRENRAIEFQINFYLLIANAISNCINRRNIVLAYITTKIIRVNEPR